MTHTISATYTTLVSLSGTADNPATITSAGLLKAGLVADSLTSAWTITNDGSILDAGVTLKSAGTLVNAGHITGSTYGVLLASGFTNRLVIDPGAVFSGTVSGGNTIGNGHISTLELASGSTGTLTSFGSKYIDFAQVTIDAGATWMVDRADSFATGVTVTDSGTIVAAAGAVGISLTAGTISSTGSVFGGTGSAGTNGLGGGAGWAGISFASGPWPTRERLSEVPAGPAATITAATVPPEVRVGPVSRSSAAA
jgi:hypothetical protein